MILTNKKNKDGSVNSFQDTSIPGTGYYVPFDDPNFINQIEPNILDSVLLLNLAGLVTFTSCQGHSIFDYIFRKGVRFNDGPNITLKTDLETFLKLKKHFNNFFITVKENKTIKKSPGVLYPRISCRKFIQLFVSNEFLCRQIQIMVESYD